MESDCRLLYDPTATSKTREIALDGRPAIWVRPKISKCWRWAISSLQSIQFMSLCLCEYVVFTSDWENGNSSNSRRVRRRSASSRNIGGGRELVGTGGWDCVDQREDGKRLCGAGAGAGGVVGRVCSKNRQWLVLLLLPIWRRSSLILSWVILSSRFDSIGYGFFFLREIISCRVQNRGTNFTKFAVLSIRIFNIETVNKYLFQIQTNAHSILQIKNSTFAQGGRLL